MTSDGRTVREFVPLQLVLSDESVQPVECELRFDAEDPYTILAVFDASGSTWLIGRELLSHGLLADLSCPAGYGDVQVWRDEDPEYLLISLSGVEGDALLAAETRVVARFLDATTALVPFGKEGRVMDGAIDSIIWELLQA